jgi:hypothetical protein
MPALEKHAASVFQFCAGICVSPDTASRASPFSSRSTTSAVSGRPIVPHSRWALRANRPLRLACRFAIVPFWRALRVSLDACPGNRKRYRRSHALGALVSGPTFGRRGPGDDGPARGHAANASRHPHVCSQSPLLSAPCSGRYCKREYLGDWCHLPTPNTQGPRHLTSSRWVPQGRPCHRPPLRSLETLTLNKSLASGLKV